LQTPA